MAYLFQEGPNSAGHDSPFPSLIDAVPTLRKHGRPSSDPHPSRRRAPETSSSKYLFPFPKNKQVDVGLSDFKVHIEFSIISTEIPQLICSSDEMPTFITQGCHKADMSVDLDPCRFCVYK